MQNILNSNMVSPQLMGLLASWVQQGVKLDTEKLLKLEQSEDYIAYIQLLKLLHSQKEANSLAQETEPLYDKVFYVANAIENWSWDQPMSIHIWSSSFVRLNDKIDVQNIPTVAELRNKSCEGILFSWVGALKIQTKDWAKIPLLQRDSGVPTDPGKYTLPAGRADKTPGLTAYEEILEELVLFGKKDNTVQLIVPFDENGWISKEKALQLVSIARWRYINSLLKRSWNISISHIDEFISAEPVFISLGISSNWKSVRTVFHDDVSKKSHEVFEKWFFPIHDEGVNTYEMVRWFNLDLTDFDDISIWDGDGFWRDTGLFTLSEIRYMDLKNDVVVALKWAIELGAFE